MSDDRDVEVTHEDETGFVAELRRLADALEAGSVYTLHVDGEDVTIPEGARLSVAHEREEGEIELEFQITWSVAATDDEADDASDEPEADTAESDDAAAT